MPLAALLATALSEAGGAATVRELVAHLRRAGHDRVPRSLVERTLREDARFLDEVELGRRRWRLAPTGAEGAADADRETAAGGRPVPSPAGAGPGAARGRLARLALRDWQAEALAAWSVSCRGVVEAVTGTGKTRLALAAITAVLDRGGRCLVLVPTLELQEQWLRELDALRPRPRVGRLGGGRDDDLHERDVVVATPQSAAAVPVDLPRGVSGLLVADEAHRYGSPHWAGALREDFALRLALTATYERGDDGVEDVLAPYFGGVVHRYGLDRAVAEGTVAPFRLALVGVGLDAGERARYDRLDARVRRLHAQLVGALGLPREPGARFAAAAAVVAEAERTGRAGPQAAACREYLALVRERREVAAQAGAKLAVCRAAAAGLAGRRTLLFADTVAQAAAAAEVLAAAGLRTGGVHGELSRRDRRARLAAFRRGHLDVLTAPRVLDEGIDVPDADVALVLAAFRTRRQLVQRLGRVLRRKDDGRHARLVLVHAADTAEDPARGGHRAFLELARPVAAETLTLDHDAAPARLAAWLGPTRAAATR